ncbi:zinc finger protein 862-like [Lineus longissimus]|uniref:zinc finger protein 862-like n=1 Tax=Lineus longissimus TaxID=88925 RepID=UPI00315DF560
MPKEKDIRGFFSQKRKAPDSPPLARSSSPRLTQVDVEAVTEPDSEDLTLVDDDPDSDVIVEPRVCVPRVTKAARPSSRVNCKICIRHGQNSKSGVRYWTSVASTAYREDRLNDHAKAIHHLVAVGLEAQREANAKSGGVKASLGAMKSMNWLVKQDTAYTTKYKRQAIKEEKIEAIKKSVVFAVLIDESTDITTIEQMLIYAKYLDQATGETKITLLGTEEMRSVNADNITRKLVAFLEDNVGLDVKKLAGFGSDGASVMAGRNNGVATQLKRLSPMLVSCHCVAHRLALAMSDIGKKVPYIKKFNELLQMLFQFYDASTVHYAGLRTIKEAIEEQVLKPKRALTTR